MPLETRKEIERGISADSSESQYLSDRNNTNKQIATHRLKLIGLNIAKVMMDVKEDSENHKLMFDDCKILYKCLPRI